MISDFCANRENVFCDDKEFVPQKREEL